MRTIPTSNEFICKDILESIDSNKYANLVYKDCPDLQNKNIGIEVTEICDPKHKEMSGNFRNIVNNIGNKEKQYAKIKENGGDIFQGVALATPKIINIDKFLKTEYEKKLKKLNKNYTLKMTNEIFFFAYIHRDISDDEIKNIINIIQILNTHYQTSFDIVYICNTNNLIKYNAQNDTLNIQNIRKQYYAALIKLAEKRQEKK